MKNAMVVVTKTLPWRRASRPARDWPGVATRDARQIRQADENFAASADSNWVVFSNFCNRDSSGGNQGLHFNSSKISG